MKDYYMKRLFLVWFAFIGFKVLAQKPLPNLALLKDSLSNFQLDTSGYFIEKIEVSNAQWRAFYEAKVAVTAPSEHRKYLPKNSVWKEVIPFHDPHLYRYFGKKSFLNFPVVGVSYEQALAFCKWRSEQETTTFAQQNKGAEWDDYDVRFHYRLPTEHEWEKWALEELKGRDVNDIASQINCRKGIISSRKTLTITEAVYTRYLDSKSLAHVFGNVSEMISEKGIAKGGNWMMTVEACKPTNKNRYTNPTAWLGFRCVLEVEIQAKAQFEDKMLNEPLTYKESYNQPEILINTDRYIISESTIQLPFAYEEDALDFQPIHEQMKHYQVVQADLVFTQYPHDLADWRINYYELLAQRLKNLFQEFPQLNNQTIKWRIVRQTNCDTKEEALQMFHGFVFTIEKKNEWKPIHLEDSKIYPEDIVNTYTVALDTFDRLKPRESVVEDFAKKHPKKLDGALVVMDWTSSMYPYACQTILMNLKNNNDFRAKSFVFFNDGDEKKDYEKKAGETGGIYVAPSDEMDYVLETMNKARAAGNGGDIPENDLEAVLKAMKNYPNVPSVVLVADNKSAMRDSVLMDSITQPIHIVLCGIECYFYGQRIHLLNPQYEQLAAQTKGSLFFVGQDSLERKSYETLPVLEVSGHKFWVLDPQFDLSGQDEFTFVFKGNRIVMGAGEGHKQKELSKFIEFNYENFPELLELNRLIRKKKDKVFKKKNKTKVDKLFKE